ncbi:MAG: LCP family protein [Propionibacteriaceae bacterium]|jgi:LCP family protein required for cell wall assembly|nr:LCP family protein [Propionibacteriaceae bacterium]
MTDITSVSHRTEVVATRRGYALVGLELVFPGMAAAIHGRQRVGRFSLKLWLFLLLLAVVAVIVTLVARNFVIGLLANSWVLRGLAIAIFAVGFFWTILMVNTWWIARPSRMGTRKGVLFSIVALVLSVALAAGTTWAGRAVWATGGALGNIFSGGGNSAQNNGRYNFLLLGSDAGPDREGVRPDSINLVSVNATTGRAAIFGFPRNLENVPFPESSPMHALYPEGVICATSEDEVVGDCLLNAIYLLGTQHADVYPGVADPGIQAMLDAVSGITGLGVNYYAMIDMQGFQDLIDAMGGLTITINRTVALNPDDGVYLEAGVDRHLTGYETLWFARARVESTDYDRMLRQRCVMSAMLKQLDPMTVATKFTALADASGQAVHTSVPSTQVGSLVDLALKARALPISSVSFTPPLIDPASPDYTLIRQMVADTIAQADALDKGQAAPAIHTAPSDTALATSEPPVEDPVDGSGDATGDDGSGGSQTTTPVEDVPVCTV